MDLKWTNKAQEDLVRLYEFLAPLNPKAAAQIVQSLVDAPARFLEHPRIGERIEAYNPREIRRIILRGYEMRYEIQGAIINVLRIWHTREER
jgi:plasmid stabilization system protein ParE